VLTSSSLLQKNLKGKGKETRSRRRREDENKDRSILLWFGKWFQKLK